MAKCIQHIKTPADTNPSNGANFGKTFAGVGFRLPQGLNSAAKRRFSTSLRGVLVFLLCVPVRSSAFVSFSPRRATLSQITLSHTSLSHATLPHTVLSHTTLSHTTRSHTTLSQTTLSHTSSFTRNFVTHNLSQTNSHATLSPTTSRGTC